jgi:hypothetical protein
MRYEYWNKRKGIASSRKLVLLNYSCRIGRAIPGRYFL